MAIIGIINYKQKAQSFKLQALNVKLVLVWQNKYLCHWVS